MSSIETPASSETGPGSEFAALSRRVRQAGLLRRRRAWYAWRISGTAAALVAAPAGLRRMIFRYQAYLPRPNLRHARPLIKAFCTERGLPYAESSLLGSYAQALRYLNQVGRQTRWLTNDPATAAAPSGSLSPRRARRPGRPAPHCAG